MAGPGDPPNDPLIRDRGSPPVPTPQAPPLGAPDMRGGTGGAPGPPPPPRGEKWAPGPDGGAGPFALGVFYGLTGLFFFCCWGGGGGGGPPPINSQSIWASQGEALGGRDGGGPPCPELGGH